MVKRSTLPGWTFVERPDNVELMSRFREKRDPRQVTNWLAQLQYEPGDSMTLIAFSGLGSVGAETVCRWTEKALAESVGVRDWAQNIIDIAQDHCDAAGSRMVYRLSHLRGEAGEIQASFTVKLLPADPDATGDDEDPSAAGQIRQLMAHNRQMMQLSMRSPMLAMESMARQLDAANARVEFLENERGKTLDLYAQALQVLAEAEVAQTPKPTVVEQVERALPLMPQIMQGIRLLTSVTKV